jgi:hypothetical protein
MPDDPRQSEPPGFAALAKRISAWTSRILLTLLVLVAGLGFGRQVLTWWAADRQPENAAAVLPYDPLGDPTQLHTLQFGDSSWSLRRRSIIGDKQRAAEQLRAACREVLASRKPRPAVAPGVGATTGRGFMKAPDASERDFLAFLSTSTPVDQKPGQWRLYELREGFPMSVGVARPSAAPAESAEPRVNLAQMGYRVVIWGVAIPSGTDGWTLCTFQSESPSADGAAGLADVPLPPQGRKMLSTRAAGGGIVTFSGPNRPAEWKKFYSDWFASRKWRPVTNWQPMGSAWYAKFAAPVGGDAIDIRFGPDGRGGLSGLMMITAGATK